MSYVLITPARNEEENLPKLAECLINQTVIPKAWVIIDDRSTDDTSNIAIQFSKQYPWVYHHRLNDDIKTDSEIAKWEFGYSNVIVKGLKFARELCQQEAISYEYLGKTDADLPMSTDFFEKLVAEFELNDQLGVASGCFAVKRLIDAPLPYGIYLIRRSVLDQIGDLPVDYDIDALISIRAKARGWETRVFPDINFKNERPIGLWNAKRHGFKCYVRDSHPFVLFWYFALQLRRGGLRPGFEFLLGYFSALFRRENKVHDKEMRYYYRHTQAKWLRKELAAKFSRRRNCNNLQ